MNFDDIPTEAFCCYWFFRLLFEAHLNTEHFYIGLKEHGLPPKCSGEPFWYHRVQLWGAMTEVIKNCGENTHWWQNVDKWEEGSEPRRILEEFHQRTLK